MCCFALIGLIYETDDLLFIDQRRILLTELRRSLIKGNHASHLVMSKNTVYWLAVSTDFDAATSRCSTCANFRNKTKQIKMSLSCHKRERDQKKKKKIQNMSHRKKNSSGPKNIVWNAFSIEDEKDTLNCFSFFYLFNDYLLRSLYV